MQDNDVKGETPLSTDPVQEAPNLPSSPDLTTPASAPTLSPTSTPTLTPDPTSTPTTAQPSPDSSQTAITPVTSVNSGDIKDELFIALRQHPKVRKLQEKIEFCSQFLLLFGIMFFVFGIVSFFYQHKKALTLIGLVSILHVIAGPLGLVAVRNNNRYMLLSLALLNIVWIGAVSLILVIFIFLSKRIVIDFNQFCLFFLMTIVYNDCVRPCHDCSQQE